MLFKEENQYLAIANNIVDNGYIDKSRTGIDIRKTHVEHMTFSLDGGRVPVPSTRYIPVKSPVVEMVWIISGSTDIEFLKKYGLGIWDSWVKPGTHRYDNRLERGVEELTKKGLIKPRADLKDTLFDKYGPGTINQVLSDVTGVDVTKPKLLGGSIGEGAYGAQWRFWEDIRMVPYGNDSEIALLEKMGYENVEKRVNPNSLNSETPIELPFLKRHDQLQAAIDTINNSPDSRRIIVSAWNPGKLDTQQLPPCHSFFQFLPFEKDGVKYLDLSLTCRSQDFLVGTVFNVMQYAVLCHMVAHLTGRKAHKLFWQGNNTHIYENQVDIFNEEHRERSPIINPDLKLVINPEKIFTNINDFTVEDLNVVGYENYHDPIKYPIAV